MTDNAKQTDAKTAEAAKADEDDVLEPDQVVFDAAETAFILAAEEERTAKDGASE